MGVAAADAHLRSGRQALAAATGRPRAPVARRPPNLGETAEAQDGLSQALHFQGEYDRAIELKERAFAKCQRRGRRVEAAELARWLAFLYVSIRGNLAAANGWMARAESLLEGVDECATHGWLALDPGAVDARLVGASGTPRRRSR